MQYRSPGVLTFNLTPAGLDGMRRHSANPNCQTIALYGPSWRRSMCCAIVDCACRVENWRANKIRTGRHLMTLHEIGMYLLRPAPKPKVREEVSIMMARMMYRPLYSQKRQMGSLLQRT